MMIKALTTLFITALLLLPIASFAEEIDFDSLSVEELNSIINNAYTALVKQTIGSEDNQVLYTYGHDAWSVFIYSTEYKDENNGSLVLYPLIINNNEEDLILGDVSCAINGWKLPACLHGEDYRLGGNQRSKSAMYFYVCELDDAEVKSLEQIKTMELSFEVELEGYYMCRITVTLTYSPGVGLVVTSREWNPLV